MKPKPTSSSLTPRSVFSASALLSLTLLTGVGTAQDGGQRNFVDVPAGARPVPYVEESAVNRPITVLNPQESQPRTVLSEQPAARRSEPVTAAVAQPSQAVEEGIPSDEVRSITRSIAEMRGEFGPIRLQSVEPIYDISVPVSSRMQVVAAQADVSYTNSISLNEDLSHIALLWDQEVVAQAPLLRGNPQGRILENLPGLPFDDGYHTLTLRAAQHYAQNGECEDPASSVLWSQIDSQKSSVTFDYRWRPLGNLVLADLPELIDPKLWGDYTLSIVTEQTHAIQNHHLRWGALMSQRAATFLDYKPLEVAHHDALVAGYDQVVIGTRTELSQILPAQMLNRVTGAFVGIYPHPFDNGHFVLILSGETNSDVDVAVSAIAMANVNLPASAEMVVNSVELPQVAAYEIDRGLKPSESVALSEIGFQTETVSGIGAPALEVEVVLPPDLYADEAENVELKLHFAHGAALRGDSVLNVKLNGRFEHAIYLKESEGATYRDYQVEIPLRSFKAGRNQLTFAPVLMPLVSGHCEIVNQENLLFTMFDDTEIKIPNASHYVRLPDLNLWKRTAFPAVVDPLGDNFTIHIASKDSDTISSAFMMAGKLAQLNGSPMLNMDVNLRMPADQDHWLTVGPWSALNREMIQHSPVQLGEGGRVPAILSRVPDARDGDLAATTRREADSRRTVVNATTAAGNRGLLLQFQSQLDAKRSGMALTAESRSVLRARTRELIQPGVWDGQSGDTFVWSGEEANQQKAQRLGESFYLGKAGVRTKAVYHFSHRPWMSVLAALVLVAILAGFVRNALAKFHRRNHAGAEA